MENGILEFINAESKYDFIAQNYYKMSKEDLKRICLELIYAIGSFEMEDAIEELKDWAD